MLGDVLDREFAALLCETKPNEVNPLHLAPLPKHIREAKYANTSLACMQNKGWFKFFTLV